MSSTRASRAVSRPLLALVLALGVDTLGTGLFVPVSLLFFTRVAGLSLATAGALTTAGAVLSLPVPLLAGWLADRWHPRTVVLAGQLLQAAGFAGYLLARAPWAVFTVIALVAVGQRLFWSTFFTLVAALPTDPRDPGGPRGRDRRYAVVGMTQSAGYGLGALATGALLAASSTTAYLWLAAANAASYLLSAALVPAVPRARAGRADRAENVEETARERAPGALAGYRALLGDRPYLALTLANTGFAIASVFLATALPVYVVDGLHAPGWIVGPVLAANTVLLAVGQLAATRLVRRLSRTRALVLAGCAWTAWSLLTAAATGVPGRFVLAYLAGVTVLYAVAELVHAPVSNALAAEAAPERSRGRYLAAFQYGFTIATIVVPGAFTALFTLDPRLPWIALATVTAAATATIAALGRHLPAHAVHPAAASPTSNVNSGG